MTATQAPVLPPVNVGMPRHVRWQGRTVYTGVRKHPVDGPAMVRRQIIVVVRAECGGAAALRSTGSASGFGSVRPMRPRKEMAAHG